VTAETAAWILATIPDDESDEVVGIR
jgi:hypothetical protein